MDPIEEITALRARIADIERRAAQRADPATLGDAVHEHYVRPEVADSGRLAALRAAASRYVPDPAMDEQLRLSKEHPELFERGTAHLDLAYYEDAQRAHEELQ